MLVVLLEPSFFADFNWASRSAKPEYQAFLQAQPSDDIARSFAVAISATAKQLDALIGALPEEEASAEIQRATVHKLLEAYRTEGAKLARITTKLESRLVEVRRCLTAIAQTQLTSQSLNQRCTENFMETNSNPPLVESAYNVPDSIYSSLPGPLSSSHISWLTHLTIIFLVILFFQVCFTFGAVNRLHGILNFILTISTSSGRKRRALRAKCVTDLENLRNQLKNVHMVDEFATYSKLERRIKMLERQLKDLAPETFVGSMARQFGIYIGLHTIEAISMAYLVSRSPVTTISPETIYFIQKTDDSIRHVIVVLCTLLSYFPAKILVICWIILCRLTIKATVSKLESRLQQQSEQNSAVKSNHNSEGESTYTTLNGSL
ncbi:unnamed protein product [Heterobilharzia americana]|nr:unnamed protein product [Heterobilharzia americana]